MYHNVVQYKCGNAGAGEIVESDWIFHRLSDKYGMSLAIPKSFNTKKGTDYF